MEIFSPLFFLFLLFISIFFYAQKEKNTKIRFYFYIGLISKILAGFGVGILYRFYYQGDDTWRLFESAVFLSQKAETEPWAYLQFCFSNPYKSNLAWVVALVSHEERTIFMIKFISFFAFLSDNHYFITSIYFSVFSFVGFWYVIKKIVLFFPHAIEKIMLSFLFYPSVLFWSSGILKESIMLPCICFLVGFALHFMFSGKTKITHLLTGIVLILCFWKIRYYYCGVLLGTLLAMLLCDGIGKRYGYKYTPFLFFGILILSFLTASQLHYNLKPEHLFGVLYENYCTMLDASMLQNCVFYSPITPDAWGIMCNAPQALISTLFVPFLWECSTFFQVIASIENSLLVLLLWKIRWEIPQKQKLVLVLGVLTFSIVMGIFLGIAAPNWGNLVRYRVGFLPFMVVLLLLAQSSTQKEKRLLLS